jgi:hypothetical protein
VPYRPDAQQTKASSVRTTWISVRTLLYIKKLLSKLASVQTFQQPVRTTLSVRSSFRFSFQKQIWEDCCNRPDDVDSRPDALLLKGKFVIQTQPSGCRSTMVWKRLQQIWKLRAANQLSGRSPPMVRTREALVRKLLAADVRPFG